MLGERRCGWHGDKSKETIQIIGSCRNQIAIPFHHLCCLAQLVQHRTAIDGIDRVQLECKRSYNAKVSTAATNGPEQIGVFVAVRFDKFSDSQYNIG